MLFARTYTVRSLRLSVRTPGFQPGKRGSIPLGTAIFLFLCVEFAKHNQRLLCMGFCMFLFLSGRFNCPYAKALYAQKPRPRVGLVGIHCFNLRAGSTALCRDYEDPKGYFFARCLCGAHNRLFVKYNNNVSNPKNATPKNPTRLRAAKCGSAVHCKNAATSAAIYLASLP